jgi:hypothetical protein
MVGADVEVHEPTELIAELKAPARRLGDATAAT